MAFDSGLAFTLKVMARRQGMGGWQEAAALGLCADICSVAEGEDSRRYALAVRNTTDAPFCGIVVVWAEVAGQGKIFMPGFLYNRNHGERPLYLDASGTTAPFPRLAPAPAQKPYADQWLVPENRVTHPVSILYSNGHALGISARPVGADAGFGRGYACRMGDDNIAVGVSFGSENSPWLYLDGSTLKDEDESAKSYRTIPAGGCLKGDFYLYTSRGDDERCINAIIRAVYRDCHAAPRKLATLPDTVRDIATAIYRDGFVAEIDNYSTRVWMEDGKAPECEPLASISWTGGVEVAAPMLFAAGRLQDQAIRQQALRCVNNIVQNSLNPANGLPFDAYNDNGWNTAGWWEPHMPQPGHSSYLIGQALFYILNAYRHEQRFFNTTHTDWLDFVRDVLLRIEPTKNAEGEVPYLWSATDGAGIEYDSFCGCWCVAAAALYCAIAGDKSLLASAARSLTHYHKSYVTAMECYGTPHDTWKAIDSEGSLSFIKAARVLHELTGEARFLDMLRDGLEYEFTYKFCWNPPPLADPLRRLGWSCCGGSVTSVCNPHTHPMSSNVLDEIDYCYAQTGDEYFKHRCDDTLDWSLQCHCTYDGEYDFGKTGWMSERFCHSAGLMNLFYPNGDPCTTWFCFLPWGASNILEGICGAAWEREAATR